MDENRDLSTNIFIPQNYSSKDKIKGTNLFNLIEGAGIATVLSFLFCNIPRLVIELKISVCVIFFIVFLFLEVKYNKDYTLITALRYRYKWKKNSKKYKLANVTEITTGKKFDIQNTINLTKKGFNNVKDEVLKKIGNITQK